MVDLTMHRVIAVTWRSVLSALAMVVCVDFAYSELMVETNLSIVTQLFLCVGVGAATYFSVVFALWWISGRPNHAETYVIGSVKKLVGERFQFPVKFKR